MRSQYVDLGGGLVKTFVPVAYAGAREFLAIAPQAGVKTTVRRYPLAQANEALADLREGRLQGAAVLLP